MDAAPSPVGVAAAAPAPPQWPAEARWIEPPSELSLRLPCPPASPWPRSAQAAAALLLLAVAALLGWHVWQAQPSRCQPAVLEADALASPSLDLNRAERAQLVQLFGVGDNLAGRIEAYRAEHHGFRTVDELRNVPGVGARMLEKLRPFVYVEASSRDDEDKPPQNPPPVVAKKKEALAERLDVNHAGVAALQRLPGIGPKRAQAIVETRQKKRFESVDDLRRVPNIGPKTLERLRPLVTVGEKST